MIVEQYKLILQHRVIDTERIEYVNGKLEPDKCVEYNYDWDSQCGVPKSIIIDRMCQQMQSMVMKDGAE